MGSQQSVRNCRMLYMVVSCLWVGDLMGCAWFYGVEFHAGGGSPDFGALWGDDGGAGDVASPEVVEDVADDPGLTMGHGGGDGGETLLGGTLDGEVVGFLVHGVWFLVLGYGTCWTDGTDWVARSHSVRIWDFGMPSLSFWVTAVMNWAARWAPSWVTASARRALPDLASIFQVRTGW